MKKIIDSRNITLAKTLYRLRQNIDIHRLIGLNTTEAKKTNELRAFFGHVQNQALDFIALDICKIYELEKRYPLNSIPGIIKNLTRSEDSKEILRDSIIFAESNGFKCGGEDSIYIIDSVFRSFCINHKTSLDTFRTHRDKFAAHSEHEFTPKSLPSHDEFELFFEFGLGFYRYISNSWLDIGPAFISPNVGTSLFNYLRENCEGEVFYDFPK